MPRKCISGFAEAGAAMAQQLDDNDLLNLFSAIGRVVSTSAMNSAVPGFFSVALAEIVLNNSAALVINGLFSLRSTQRLRGRWVCGRSRQSAG
jgi:mevalonate pyrophosphate decarboxylase